MGPFRGADVHQVATFGESRNGSVRIVDLTYPYPQPLQFGFARALGGVKMGRKKASNRPPGIGVAEVRRQADMTALSVPGIRSSRSSC